MQGTEVDRDEEIRFWQDRPLLGLVRLAPGRYFRLLLIGYFEGLDSERAIAWCAADSFALRQFLGLALVEWPPPDGRPRRRGVRTDTKFNTRSKRRQYGWKNIARKTEVPASPKGRRRRQPALWKESYSVQSFARGIYAPKSALTERCIVLGWGPFMEFKKGPEQWHGVRLLRCFSDERVLPDEYF